MMGTQFEVILKSAEVKSVDDQKSIIETVYAFADSKGLTVVKLRVWNPDPQVIVMSRLTRLIEILIGSLVLIYMMTPIHEKAHSNMISFLGGDSYTKFTFLSGVTRVTKIPEFQYWWILTALAGGLTVVALYLALDVLIIEPDTSLALRVVASHQFSYAILEGLGHNLMWYANIIIGISMIVTLILSRGLLRGTLIKYRKL